jgi:hypothetical protein
LATLPFFAVFALGLRGSLVDRFCPLAIAGSNIALLDARARIRLRPGIEIVSRPLEQSRPRGPGLGAAFKCQPDMSIACSRRSFPIVRCQLSASFRRIFGLSSR